MFWESRSESLQGLLENSIGKSHRRRLRFTHRDVWVLKFMQWQIAVVRPIKYHFRVQMQFAVLKASWWSQGLKPEGHRCMREPWLTETCVEQLKYAVHDGSMNTVGAHTNTHHSMVNRVNSLWNGPFQDRLQPFSQDWRNVYRADVPLVFSVTFFANRAHNGWPPVVGYLRRYKG